MRTDLSATLFLTPPEDYDGGELLVEDTYGVHKSKLPAGDLVLYPATSLHRVEPVTRGARISSFFWIQSMVADDGRRSLLFDLDMAIVQPDHATRPASVAVSLTGCLSQPAADVGRDLRDDERGYLTDVEYTGDFFAHLAPARLAYIAAVNGFRRPSLDRFTYCELGCGQGITSLVLAATHPSGEFHACDFNAAHIDAAESLRKAGGVENLQLHARSFSEMLDADLPAFDFIVLHGVYSWVPDEVRGEIREFLRRKLRPGGLVMASYNAMPGWAHLTPIRRMLRTFAADQPGSSLDKARAAYAQVASLARDGAGYFATHPAAAEHVKGLAVHDIRYIAHEYLTPHGDPFWFDEVAQDMAQAGLAFAGSMTAADNYAEISVPAAFVDRIAREPSRVRRESMRDIVANTAFRRDLFVMAAQPAIDMGTGVGIRAFDGLGVLAHGSSGVVADVAHARRDPVRPARRRTCRPGNARSPVARSCDGARASRGDARMRRGRHRVPRPATRGVGPRRRVPAAARGERMAPGQRRAARSRDP